MGKYTAVMFLKSKWLGEKFYIVSWEIWKVIPRKKYPVLRTSLHGGIMDNTYDTLPKISAEMF